VLRAYVGAGSIKLAAHRLGISESTARQHLAGLYRRTGCQNAVQAAYLLGASEGRAA
jgi:DNA-binding CsgD family transcriptional regulator